MIGGSHALWCRFGGYPPTTGIVSKFKNVKNFECLLIRALKDETCKWVKFPFSFCLRSPVNNWKFNFANFQFSDLNARRISKMATINFFRTKKQMNKKWKSKRINSNISIHGWIIKAQLFHRICIIKGTLVHVMERQLTFGPRSLIIRCCCIYFERVVIDVANFLIFVFIIKGWMNGKFTF